MKALLWLVFLAVLSTAIQPAIAARFSIYVYDSDSRMPIENVLIRVWDGNTLLDTGNTNSDGKFITTLLFDGKRYRIRAQTFDKWNETNYLAESSKSTEIKLYLHA